MTRLLDRPSRVRPCAWFVYLVAMAGLTAAYMLGHFVGLRWLNSGPVYNIIGASTVVALIVGARKKFEVPAARKAQGPAREPDRQDILGRTYRDSRPHNHAQSPPPRGLAKGIAPS